MVAIQGLWDVYEGWREKHGALDENLAAAELLREDGHYDEAWAMHEASLELAPASLDVRHRQAQLAMQWLRETRTPGDTGYAGLRAKVEPVLYRGLVGARPSYAADVLAHIALATYLAGLETREHGEEGALLERALAHDPDNPYALTMTGFWTVYDGQDKAAAIDEALGSFETALASADDRGWVREWQLLAFHNAIAGASDDEVDDQVAIGGQLLSLVNDMRRAGEPVPVGKDRQMILDVHGTRRRQAEHADRLLQTLPTDEHLTTMKWLVETDGDDGRYDVRRTPQTRYVVARLLEAQGSQAEAITIYEELAQEPDRSMNKELNVRVDEAVLRLTGVETARAEARRQRKYLNDPMPADADPWSFHAETLLRFDPVWHGRNIQDALEYFAPYEPDAASAGRAADALALFRQARDRVNAWLDPRESNWAEHGYQLINDRSDAEISRRNLRDIWWTLANILMVDGQWDLAIAELDGLLERTDSGIAGIRYDLACAYSRRSETHADSAIGQAKSGADRRQALLELEAAVGQWRSEGETVDWAHVKSDRDLDALRESDVYVKMVAGSQR